MILGQYIMKGNKIVVIFFCDDILLIGGSQTWNFPTHRQRREVKVQHVSTLSMSRAMQRSNFETYATIIRETGEDDGMGMLVPAEIYDLLYRYENLMPEELSKVLPPRREFDHHIELELGKKPPAKAPYCLSGPELEELKDQLEELVDVGFVRP